MPMRWIRLLFLPAALIAPQVCHAAVLDGVVGHYPHERVSGRRIYEIATVRNSMGRLLGREDAALVRSYTTAGPIEALQDAQIGRLMLVWQCQAHNCPNQAAVFLHPDGEAVAACIARERDGMFTTDWIGQGWRTTMQDPTCPEGDEALTRLNAAKARATERDASGGKR
jgi:hypothetical protein